MLIALTRKHRHRVEFEFSLGNIWRVIVSEYIGTMLNFFKFNKSQEYVLLNSTLSFDPSAQLFQSYVGHSKSNRIVFAKNA